MPVTTVNTDTISNSLKADRDRILPPLDTNTGNGTTSIGAPKAWDPAENKILEVSTARFAGDPGGPGQLDGYVILFTQDALGVASTETSADGGRLLGTNVEAPQAGALPGYATPTLTNGPLAYREGGKFTQGAGPTAFRYSGYIIGTRWFVDELPSEAPESVRLGVRFHSFSSADYNPGVFQVNQTTVREVLWPASAFTAQLNATRQVTIEDGGATTTLVIVGLYELQPETP